MKDMYECTDVSPYAEKNGFEVGAVYEGATLENGDVRMYSPKYRSFFEIGSINESGIARFKRVNSDK